MAMEQHTPDSIDLEEKHKTPELLLSHATLQIIIAETKTGRAFLDTFRDEFGYYNVQAVMANGKFVGLKIVMSKEK